MRTYLIVFVLFFAAVFGGVWKWAVAHRLSYLSRDYAILQGKEKLIETYSSPGLVLFGDSMVMNDLVPDQLGPGVIDLGMSGSTPIESYFLVRRLLKASVKPAAVFLSFSAYHFVHPNFYWENTVKFGLLTGSEADEVEENIRRTGDKELTIADPGLWGLQQALYSFLLSRGFPSYSVSSFFAQPYGVREKENREALDLVVQNRGYYSFPQMDGSRQLNNDTELQEFHVSPVVDLYFQKTLDLLKEADVPVYFADMPVNEISVPQIKAKVIRNFRLYLSQASQRDPQFQILDRKAPIYSWKLFSDSAHLNDRGRKKFNHEFARMLDQARVPGGPYEIEH